MHFDWCNYEKNRMVGYNNAGLASHPRRDTIQFHNGQFNEVNRRPFIKLN